MIALKQCLPNRAANIKALNVKMDDWESVISKDKKEEWVTLMV